MRKHNIINTNITYNRYRNQHQRISNNEQLLIPTTRQTPTESATFTSCSFTSLTSAVSGAAIAFTSGSTLIADGCIFTNCIASTDKANFAGGGAIFIRNGALSVSWSSFVRCTTPSYGGGIHASGSCTSSSVSFSSFLHCEADHGSGITTFFGPSSTVLSCRFISCHASSVGGGIYHDSDTKSDSLSISDSLFTDNQANFVNGSSSADTRGGGAFEDYRLSSYSSKYSFSFFTRNSAPYGVGNDISINGTSLSLSNIKSCFTTTTFHSLWNTKYTGYDN